jgi:CRP-like cAMP-binding protein
MTSRRVGGAKSPCRKCRPLFLAYVPNASHASKPISQSRLVTPAPIAGVASKARKQSSQFLDSFGEGCLAGQPQRISTVETMTGSVIVRLEKAAIVRGLHGEPAFSEMYRASFGSEHPGRRGPIDQLFNSTEKRLARVLLLLANFGKEGKPEPVIANISQETLAEMIGTTRSRVGFFMNKFRKLDFIDYNGGMEVHTL